MSKSNSGANGKTRLTAEERRAQLVETAFPLFAARGYEGTGTRELARAAGVSEPILYRHFAGKAGLFQAVLETAEQRLEAALAAAMAGTRGASARLKALASGLPQLLDAHGAELRILNAAAHAQDEPEILAAAGSALRRLGLSLSKAFEGSGLRRGVSAETAGFLLLEVGMGASILHPLALPEMDRDGFKEGAIDALLRGIAR